MNKYLIIILLIQGCVTTKYASQTDKMHCPPAECPGEKCLCIKDQNEIWYLNPEVGE